MEPTPEYYFVCPPWAPAKAGWAKGMRALARRAELAGLAPAKKGSPRLLLVEGWRERQQQAYWAARAGVKNFLDVPAGALPRCQGDEEGPAAYALVASSAPRCRVTGTPLVERRQNFMYFAQTPGHRGRGFDREARALAPAARKARPYPETDGGFQLYRVAIRNGGVHAEPATLTRVAARDLAPIIGMYRSAITLLLARTTLN